MKAPPRSREAPEAFTDWATSMICSRLSTEQGPAMTVNPPPPMTASPMRTALSSGWNFRLAFLYGSWTRITRSTSWWMVSLSWSIWEVSPTRPRMEQPTPLVMLTRTSGWSVSSWWARAWMVSCVAEGFITITIRCSSFLLVSAAGKRSPVCKNAH